MSRPQRTPGGFGMPYQPSTRERYVVKYGRVDGKHRYVHSHPVDLDTAKRDRDRWLAGGAWGGTPQDDLRVWVEDAHGDVVYGEAP